MMKQKVFTIFKIAGVFGLLAIIMTWPLALHLGTHIPGEGGDGLIFLWDTWWVKYSLLVLKTHPFHTDHLFAPQGVSLTFHTLFLFTSLLSVPLQLMFGSILSFNLLYLLGFVASGLGMMFLLQTLGVSKNIRWVGALLFCFSPYVMARSMGHFNLAAVWPLPWAIAFFWKLRWQRKRRDALLFGPLWGLSLLNELHYAFFIGLFSLIVLIRDLVIRFRKRHDIGEEEQEKLLSLGSRYLVLALFVVLGFLLVAWPSVFSIINRIRAGTELGVHINEQASFSLDALSLILPDMLHPVWGDFFAGVRNGISSMGVENIGYLGIANIFLLGIGWWLSKRKKIDKRFKNWFWLGVLFLILAMGPFLTIAGENSVMMDGTEVRLPLPFILIRWLPLGSVFRTPNRFMVLVYLCFAIADCFALEALLAHLKLSGKQALKLVLFLCFFVFFDFLSAPFPLNDARIPEFYQNKKAFEGIETIMDLPLGWRSGQLHVGNMQAQVQYYQTAHEKKVVTGYISRVPDELFWFYPYRPGMAGFMEPWIFNPWEIDKLDASPQQVAQTLADLGVDGIVVHSDMMDGETPRYVGEYLEQIGWGKKHEQGTKVLYVRN